LQRWRSCPSGDVVENIPEGIVVKDARNLRYVFVNKAAEEMIGMSRGLIMGKTRR
jgi:PAS domain-containing protein